MRDILDEVAGWTESGHRFALAVVTQTWGSSPRPAGSWMAVREDGAVVGSVSGGCVEGAVAEAAAKALTSGQPEWLTFEGLDPEDVWKVGLSCGGRIKVLVLPAQAEGVWPQAFRRMLADESFAIVTDGRSVALWPSEGFDLGEAAAALALEAVRNRSTLERDQWVAISQVPRPTLLIVGAVHIALPLIGFARELGFRTSVIEPRSRLALAERFASAPDEIEVQWPQLVLDPERLDANTFAVVLTHDPKIDDPALAILIRSKVAYIGALGSRTTQAQRRQRLLAQGFTEQEVDRIRGPVGLPLGAKTPAEIALSIMAEIVQVRRGTT